MLKPERGDGEVGSAMQPDKRNWTWPLAGIVVTGAVLFLGYLSHGHFRQTLIGSFNDQQALFARSLEFAIQDHLLEEEQDLRSAIRTVVESGRSIADAENIFLALYSSHLEDFDSVSIHQRSGGLLYGVPKTPPMDSDLLFFLDKTLSRHSDLFRAFLSESRLSDDGGMIVYLCVPFNLPADDNAIFVAVAGIKLEDYLLAHFPSWRGRRMGFVLSDNDGDLLALLNTAHDLGQKMIPGNIFSLAERCLNCHGPEDFKDIRRSFGEEAVVHSISRPPGGGLEKNRTSIPFTVFNETWSITILSPFESIQRAVSRNLTTNLFLTALALVLLATIAYFSSKAASYEKLAETAAALKRSEAELRRHAGWLEEANRLKDLFTDIVRHDLISAVAAVKGYAAILSGREEDGEKKKLFTAMGGSIAKLHDLIESSAMISKLEEKEGIDLESLDTAALLRNSVQRISPLAAKRQITIDLIAPAEVPLLASPLLEEVFTNLLSNAVKYSPPGSRVEVRVEGTGHEVAVSVTDWGEGIADIYKEKIFNRLERLDKEGIRGSGLGLAIVKRILDLHGGHVDVGDNPEGGTVFTVHIPRGS